MKILAKQTLLRVSIASLLLAAGVAEATNGYMPHGVGTKAKGLAGSGSAMPQDAMVMAMNPAGLVAVGSRIDAGAAIFSPARQYTVSGSPSGAQGSFPLYPGEVESDSEYFLIPHFGYSKSLDSASSWGVAVYGNGGMNTDYPAFTNPYCQQLGGGSGSFCAGGAGINLEQLFIVPTYARQFASGTASWGASLILAGQRFKATGLDTFAGFSADATKLTGKGNSTSTGFGVRLGLMGEIASGVSLAASYQPKMSMSEFDEYAGLFAEQGGFDIPANWNVGLAWATSPTSALTFDIQGIQYSAVDSVGNGMSVAALMSGALFGSDQGVGFGWDDMTVYKLGYQWQGANDWVWRVGYSHADQPIGEDDVTLNVLAPGVMEDHFTFGFTKATSDRNELSLAAMYAPSVSVKGANALDPTQSVELEMSQFELEMSYAWKF